MMFPPVITYNNAGVLQAAQALYAKAAAERKPDLIIGIQSGGWHVATAITTPQTTLLPITCRRDSTTKKQQSYLFNILASLPYRVTDWLRVLEHLYRAGKHTEAKKVVFDPAEVAAIGDYLRENPEAFVLIIDDAVDSGATLKNVTETVCGLITPPQIVKTAAITVTTCTPLIEPDYSLHHHVLCRFPWSYDYKG